MGFKTEDASLTKFMHHSCIFPAYKIDLIHILPYISIFDELMTVQKAMGR